MKSILITGTSTGIGRAAVRHFSDHGWQVAATMRRPEQEQEMQHWKHVKLYPLDVTDEAGIRHTVTAILQDFGKLDVICNNAGYGAVGIFEKASAEEIKKQFDTNVFGCMNVIRAILPHFRDRKAGTIINITSVGGQVAFPLYSVYHGTKWAMEGFSESLAFELRPFGIKVKCIEPGPIKTDFYNRSQVLFKNASITAYDEYEKTVMQNLEKAGATAPGPEVVAKAIYKAATDRSNRIRYAAGMDAAGMLALRKILPVKAFSAVVRAVVEKGVKRQ